MLKAPKIERSNKVWAVDITNVPVQGGYLYLCIILYSRYVVGWYLSNTMTTSWCLQTLPRAIEQHGAPEILSTDPRSQLTALEFMDWVTGEKRHIPFSMDSKGRAIDIMLGESLWRSVKYEHMYLFPASDGLECYRGLRDYFKYYNTKRRHQNLQDETPQKVYKQQIRKAA